MCGTLPLGGEGNPAPSSRGTDLDMLSVWADLLRLAGIGMADAAASIEIDAEVNEVEIWFGLVGSPWACTGAEDREREESAAAAVCSDAAL